MLKQVHGELSCSEPKQLAGTQHFMLPCDACQQVDGVLSELEAARFIETAERLGLEHQGSRGAAHGEVHDHVKLSLDSAKPIDYHLLVVIALFAVQCNGFSFAVKPHFIQAHRDNERVAFQDEAFAKHLWQMSGLADVFRQMDLDNQTAIGVNPNIRLYK